MLIDIYAPISGVISELEIKRGMYVTPQQNIMSIVNLDSVWLSAEVFPHQAQYLKIGDEIIGKVNGLNRIFNGVLTFISPTIDPITRTVTIRATLDNTEHVLKPNLYMDVSILSQQSIKALSVPSLAIIRLKDINYVILETGNGQFGAQEIALGLETNGYTQVLSGLKPGAKVVTSAQFMIDSESNVQASLQRLGLAESNQDSANTNPIYQGMGIIQNINKDEHMVTLAHEPIKALNWPAMTMSFKVANNIDMSNIELKQTIYFELQKTANSYEITKISRTNK